jgi:hypothetical protein
MGEDTRVYGDGKWCVLEPSPAFWDVHILADVLVHGQRMGHKQHWKASGGPWHPLGDSE